MAHPAKDSSSPWWYGMLLQEGKSGWFPNNYVEEIKRESRLWVGRFSLPRFFAHHAIDQPTKPRHHSLTPETRMKNCPLPKATL